MKPNEISHYKSLIKQDTANRILIKKLQLDKQELKQQLSLNGVVASLPTTKEIESRIKHVVENSFEDYEAVEKREYSLGFRACFNWLKIKQMKNKG